jgi:hypothetical protein
VTGPDLLEDIFDPDERPSLWRAVKALRTTHPRYPWVEPSEEEAEVADLLEELDGLHAPSTEDADNPADHPILRIYGVCLGCAETWPCAGWSHAEQLSIQWLGRASDRVWARVQETIAKQKGSAA